MAEHKREPIAKSGRLEMIVGPMFSGKSSELQRRLRRLRLGGKKVLFINSEKDVRNDQPAIVPTTHDGLAAAAGRSVKQLFDIPQSEAIKYDVIAVDEGQFFSALYGQVMTWVNVFNMHLIVAALDTDFETNAYIEVMKLMPQAESITKLCAVCHSCGSEHACFSARTVPGTEREMVGGAEAYVAACRACHSKLSAAPYYSDDDD